jgi:ATP-dependent RNA helicase RhlE
MTFQALNLSPSLLSTLVKEGYEQPSPIQAQAIPVLLEGRDVLASAQTGTGKTAAFALPIIQQLSSRMTPSHPRRIQALILAPTRELAEQIKESFNTYGGTTSLKTAVIYGGVSQKHQEVALKRGVDVLIATPGRLMDLMSQHLVDLKHVQYFVLDEADRMLDMGFSRDVRKIVTAIPVKRQTMLFSATIPHEILDLANELLTNPVRIEVTPP